MKHFFFIFSIFLCGQLLALGDRLGADFEPPVIDVNSISPALGEEVTSNRVTVSGTITDSVGTSPRGTAGIARLAGVKRVLYRFDGSQKWRRALLTNEGGATTTFVFTFSLKQGQSKRVYIRAFDNCSNESDTIARKFQRS